MIHAFDWAAYIRSPFMQGPRHHEFLVWYRQRGPGKVRMCLELFYDQSDKSLDPNRKGSVKSFTRYLCGYNVQAGDAVLERHDILWIASRLPFPRLPDNSDVTA
ncbi:hypothetical protein SCP_1400460 [Sparassis crispa]|uniref:Uncharacterized protein n=1 Tax=Sparassis crispa TaxID=139825 RepID=A0A401H2I8_9APHY|nr:hypothetical protein SCP_1400460 [Sparassis crispa]GBE88641.1 hypothetical protein SCP_1400460 [Sparassis crispa]